MKHIALLALVAVPLALRAQDAPRLATQSTSVAMTTSATPAADSAIQRLETFLQRYPESPLRPNALFQLGELLVRRAEEQFAATQRASAGQADSAVRADAPVRPDFSGAIARYEELIRRYPTFERIEAASYTLGTLYSSSERFAEAAPLFERVAGGDSSGFEAEALFRLGDARFELASKERGTPRRAGFARAARAYEQATAAAPANGDIYFLSLYKLGWSYYNHATQTNQDEYRQAANAFGRLVAAYHKATPARPAARGLRGEA